MPFNPNNNGENSFSYLYYKELFDNESDYWKGIGLQAQEHFTEEANSWRSSATTNLESLSNFFLSLAESEYRREVNVLSRYYGLSQNDIQSEFYRDSKSTQKLYSKVHATLQQALIAEETTRHTLRMLEEDQLQSQKKSRGYQTSAAHLIVDKFISSMKKYIASDEFAKEIIQSKVTQKRGVEIIMSKAYEIMEKAFTTVARYTEVHMGYTDPQKRKYVFENLYKISRDTSETGRVIALLMKTFNIPEIAKSLMEDVESNKSQKNKGKKGKKADYIGASIAYGGKGQAGFVEEAIIESTACFANNINNNSGNWVTITKRFGGGKTASTDFIWVRVRFDADTDKINEILNSTSSAKGFNNKAAALSNMENMTTRLSEITHGQFAMIQETTKAYVLGSNFDYNKDLGFTGSGFKGTTYNYHAMLDLMHRLGKNDAGSILNALMNMRAGTVMGVSNKYRERIKLEFARLFANMMFERPTITLPHNGGNNIIYVFRLSGTVVPLSYVLRCAGLAVKTSLSDLQNIMSFTISSPPASKLLYTNITDYSEGSEDFANMSEKNHLKSQEMRWKRQREQAQSELTISIHFLKNFVSFLTGDLRGFLNM